LPVGSCHRSLKTQYAAHSAPLSSASAMPPAASETDEDYRSGKAEQQPEELSRAQPKQPDRSAHDEDHDRP
jgi:hypothetical protein